VYVLCTLPLLVDRFPLDAEGSKQATPKEPSCPFPQVKKMGMLYPVTGAKFVFASTVLLAMMGWFSVVQNLQHAAVMSNCPHEQHLQEWKAQAQIHLQTQVQTRQVHVHARQDWQQLASRQLDIMDNKPSSSSTPTSIATAAVPPKRRLRVLMGIFTMDKPSQMPYRRQFRKLFDVFHMYNDTRVCSLHDFAMAPNDEIRYQCQLIYTFVVGGLPQQSDNQIRTELVQESLSKPFLLPLGQSEQHHIRNKDLIVNNDVTFLNIQENMNDGKSQTWFAYATKVMKQYDLDYAGKMDSDSLPYLDKFFDWARTYLPPPPYNQGILAGAPVDKMWWKGTKKELAEDVREEYFKSKYGKVMHLYAAGQCYILSRDLAETVVLEAPKSQVYREGHEDHDIGAMAFHSAKPISFHFLSLQQQFWRHPIKRTKKRVMQWRTFWHNENVRLKKVLERRQAYLDQHGMEGVSLVDEDSVTTPDQLAPPVQLTLDEENNGGEEGEEEEVADMEEDEEDLER
jgi:Galactosyltransferase